MSSLAPGRICRRRLTIGLIMLPPSFLSRNVDRRMRPISARRKITAITLTRFARLLNNAGQQSSLTSSVAIFRLLVDVATRKRVLHTMRVFPTIFSQVVLGPVCFVVHRTEIKVEAWVISFCRSCIRESSTILHISLMPRTWLWVALRFSRSP